MRQEFHLPFTEFPIPVPSEAFPGERSIALPVLPIVLVEKKAKRGFQTLSLLDSGADRCVFPALFGREIGLNVEAGKKAQVVGVGGLDVAYFHNVVIQFSLVGRSYHYSCYARFSTALDQLGFGLLGRHGFFDVFEDVSFDTKRKLVRLVAEVNEPRSKS